MLVNNRVFLLPSFTVFHLQWKKTFFLFLFVYLLTNDISFSFYSDKLQILWNVLLLAHKNNDKCYLESNVWKIGEGEEEGYIHIFLHLLTKLTRLQAKKLKKYFIMCGVNFTNVSQAAFAQEDCRSTLYNAESTA